MTSTIANRKAFIGRTLDIPRAKILEIGPAHGPTYSKSETDILYELFFSR